MSAPAAAPPVRVLVVDDQALFRRAVVMMLAMDPGYTVVGEAGDGESAVDMAARLNPTLVVMDVRLPGMDGVATTRRLCQVLPGVAVILVSTHSRAELPEGHETCGAIAFRPKEELSVDLLNGLLRGRDGGSLHGPMTDR
ncbi:MAG TPA: response regulator transcription factor [Dermatophilaceae bacterium]|nr:response regulator transcription factor [Dermatophilaceae bacterium]